jgi:hypothetical protein
MARLDAVQTSIRITLLTGLRRGALLRLTSAALRQDGSHIIASKTRAAGLSTPAERVKPGNLAFE